MKHLWSLVLVLFCFEAFASKVDSVRVYSPSMNKEINCVIITPDAMQGHETPKFPVVYLLNGYGGNHQTWITHFPYIKDLSDAYGMILVSPDGNNSWYWDSPIDPKMKYETFVVEELVAFVDRHYPTQASRRGRAVTGLSMGGHGALFLSFRHQDVFGAAGSMSGGVDFRPFPRSWQIAKRLGAYSEHPEIWEQHTVMSQLHRLVGDHLALLIDCGTEDFFFEVNERLHRELLYRNIPHDYTTRSGAHNTKYWASSLRYHLLFFNQYFKKHL